MTDDPRTLAADRSLSSDPPPEPACYPASEYLRLLRLVDIRLATIICNLAPFYYTDFDPAVASIREHFLAATGLLDAAILKLKKETPL
jgi:hypothetical protein